MGVNASGLVSGQYQDGTGWHGFVGSGATFTKLDIPSALPGNTYGWGVNDRGDVAGFYFDGIGAHGFIATNVPEPAAWMMLSAGLCALGLLRSRAQWSPA
jgi:hypothetical protein